MALHLKQDVKDLHRLERIVLVFMEEGLGYYVSKTGFRHLLPLSLRVQPSPAVNDVTVQAMRLRRAFEHLGPTFVKLGQLLSLRPDLVPSEYSQEFERLQDHVPPFNYGHAKEMIEADLGNPIAQLFRSFDRKPFASASMAQVHRAVLKTGQHVAVKVQRPDIQEVIDTDLDILFFLAHALEAHFPVMRPYRPVDVVREFALWTRRELNFEHEAKNARRLREEMKKNTHVRIPRIFTELSSRRVLTMEFIDGVKLSDIEKLGKYHVSSKSVAMTYFSSILEQALIHGFFHADPHPANILVQKDGKLAYIDYGLMGELSLRDRDKVIRFIRAIPEKNPDKSLSIIISLAKDTRKADLAGFKDRALPILEDMYGHTLQETSIGEGLYDLITLGGRYGIQFDPNHILMVKAIYQAEGLGLKLNPDFRISDGLQNFADKYLKMEYTPEEVLQRATHKLWENTELLSELPEHVIKIMNRLERPEEPTRIDVQQLQEFEARLEALNRWRMMGVVIAAMIVSSSFLFYVEGRTTLWGLPIADGLLIVAIIFIAFFLLFHTKTRSA